MQVLRAAERLAAPWKNGGGATWEVAAEPIGAGFEGFIWRVSLAEVAAAGPFSSFAGVDRILAVLAGELLLEVADRGAVLLTPASDPLHFAGDAAATASVPAGPVRDLNVMTRRGSCTAQVDIRDLDGWETVRRSSTEELLIVVLQGEARTGCGERLRPRDAVRLSLGADLELRLGGPVRMACIRFAYP